jgi:hypothetical protein
MNFQLDVIILAVAVLIAGTMLCAAFIFSHLCGYYLVDRKNKNALIEFTSDPTDIGHKRILVMLVSEADLPDERFVDLSDDDCA